MERATSFTAGTSGIFEGLRTTLALRLRRNRAYRKTFAELSGMSDRDLADIGISRIMIADVATEAAARA